MQEKLKPRSDIISSMFFSACIAMIFTAAAGVVAHTVDGIIASRFLGTNTYSAISLLGPFSSALTMLAGFISTGCQVVTSRLIGTGKKEESDSVFSISVVALIGLDHVRVFEYGKKTERLDHVDIEWRYVRDVELFVSKRQGHIDVNAHDKTYTVDLEYYMVFGTKLKSWQKAIKQYSQMPGTHITRW